MGLKNYRPYIIGLCLSVLLITGAASADARKKLNNMELEKVYSLLFSGVKQLRQGERKGQKNRRVLSKRQNSRRLVVQSAKNQLRKKYRWGGASPRTGFDCSGLMQYAFKSIKVNIPRTAIEQYRRAKPIPFSKLQAGDLIFFHTRRTRVRVNHVGLYLGNGEFIHAPRRGKRVSVAKFNRYWRRKAVGAGRI